MIFPLPLMQLEIPVPRLDSGDIREQLEKLVIAYDLLALDTPILRHRTRNLDEDMAYVSFLKSLLGRQGNVSITSAVRREIISGIDRCIMGRRLAPLRNKIEGLYRTAQKRDPVRWSNYTPYLKMARKLLESSRTPETDLSPEDADMAGHVAYLGFHAQQTVALCSSHRRLLNFTVENFDLIRQTCGRPRAYRKIRLDVYWLNNETGRLELYTQRTLASA